MPNLIPTDLAQIIALHKEMFGGWTMTASNPEPDPSGGDPEPDADKGKKAEDKPLGPNGEKALAAERDARKESDRKLAQMESKFTALAEALGVTPDTKTDGDDKLDALVREVAGLRHTALAERVAREHSITDTNDLALLREQPSEAAMTRLAARLKPATGDKPDQKNPKPDPSIGKGSGDTGGAKPSSIAEVMAERRKARAAT